VTETEALPDSAPLVGDPAALRARARSDGALLLRGMLDPALAGRVRALALYAAAERGWLHRDRPWSEAVARPGLALGAYDEDWAEVHRAVVVDPAWAALGEAEPLLAALETVLGTTPAGGHGSVLRAFSPNGDAHTTPPHQELAFIGGPPDAWAAWIPLGPCPRALGGLAVMRGSHRLGLLPHSDDHCTRVPDGEPWATADYDPGDVLLVHCLTLHRALPNRDPAGRLRLSADFRFRPA
jgi:Phytanoyl-CoA dioxygenase (PhyH)